MFNAVVFCAFLSFLLPTASEVHCKDLGTFGSTYEIAEKDFLQEMQEKAKQADWSKIVDKKKLLSSVKGHKPADLKKIQPTHKDNVFTVSMSYTLEFNITDEKGTIIYPKGYTFNPLEFVNYDRTIVIINATDKKQVDWFVSSEYFRDPKTTLIITDGSYYDMISKVKRPVYYAGGTLLDKFKIAAVPSVIKQKGNVMEVKEIYIGDRRARK